MASLLPRGVASPRETKQHDDLPSPSEDLHLTVQRLLATNSSLEEKVKELEGDRDHFQRKLEEYIRHDREQEGTDDQATVPELEKKVSELIAEKADLQFQLRMKDIDTNPPDQQTHKSDREQRAFLLQRLNEVESNSRYKQEHYTHQLERLKTDNTRLRQEIETLRKNRHYTDWKGATGGGGGGGGRERPPSWELSRPYPYRASYTEGYSSLPESLSNSNSTGGQSSGPIQLPDVASLRLSSNPSPTPDPTTAAELKKIKRQLEKYKSVNIELDLKLKDATLELQKLAEWRRPLDVGNRMDVERLRSENAQLRSQLDRTLSENSHLKSMVGSRY